MKTMYLCKFGQNPSTGSEDMNGYKSGRQYISPLSRLQLGGHNNLNFRLQYFTYLHLCYQKGHKSVARF